jgi:hypothetical protein
VFEPPEIHTSTSNEQHNVCRGSEPMTTTMEDDKFREGWEEEDAQRQRCDSTRVSMMVRSSHDKRWDIGGKREGGMSPNKWVQVPYRTIDCASFGCSYNSCCKKNKYHLR